ncbi:hypothetical protein E2542_SST19428 [Spatholobus suberectus]|nr:hypothetical protein E2542_SST19428 [Spatholobus suberectus]
MVSNRPQKTWVIYESLKGAILTSNAINVDEGDCIDILTMEGTSFPSFPSNAGTKSSNSSHLPCFISQAGSELELEPLGSDDESKEPAA